MQLRLPLADAAMVRGWARTTLRSNRAAFGGLVLVLGLATVAGLAGPQILGLLVDGTSTTRIDLLALLFVVLLALQATLKRAVRLRGNSR